MTNSCEAFASNLKRRRRELKMTQKELAEAIGYSEKSISKWESGQAIAPSILLPRLAIALKTSIDTLFASSESHSYFLGIDGGGTNTELLLADNDGRIIAKTVVGGSNPVDVGMQKCLDTLAEGIFKVCGNIPTTQISVFAGLAGGITGDNKEIIAEFLKKYNFAKARNGSDAENAVAAALGDENGSIVIMGTGSIAFSQIDRKLIRRRGFGYLFEEGGSGYAIGRDAIVAALYDEEGSGGHTEITELVREILGEREIRKNLTKFYSGGKRYIASFAPTAVKAYKSGDALAKKIIENNMYHVARLIEATPDTQQSGKQKIVIVGGLSHESDLLIPIIQSNLSSPEKYEIVASQAAPALGALKLAGAKNIQDRKDDKNA